MSWEEAAREAMINAEEDQIILATIELRHPLISAPVRLVCAYTNYSFKLEDDAPVDPGQVVEFIACPFEFDWPAMVEGKAPSLTLNISNVSRMLTGYLEAAIQSLDPIQLTVRPYLESAPLDGPAMNPVIHMQMDEVLVDDNRVRGEASMEDIHNAPFPRNVYTPDRFPGLRR